MVVRLMGDATSYLGMLRTSSVATQQVTEALSMQSRKIEGYYQSIIGFGNQVKYTFLSALGVVTGFGVALGSIQKAAAAEDLEIAFGTFLQDMKAGKVLMQEIQKFAASTPLGTQQIAQVTKQLLQAQAATAETAIPTIRMLGDIAGGNAERLNGLAYAFGQVRTFGRLMGGELMQLMNAGFNPLDQIAKMTGKSQGQLRQEMEKGLITFEMVREAMVQVTSKGGRFYNGMENASKTLSGLWSTLKDEVDLTLQAIGEAFVKGFEIKQMIHDITVFAGEVRKGTEIAANGFIYVKDQIANLIKENLELIKAVGKVITILTTLWLVFKAGQVSIGATLFLLKLLKIDLLLSTSLWALWTASVLAAKGVMLLFSLSMVTFNVVFAATNLLVNIWTMGATAAAAATWLWNAALAVLNAALAVPAIVAFAAAMGVVVVVAASIYAGIMAVVKVTTSLFNVFSRLGDAAQGPISQISKMFVHWKDAVSDVTRAVQVDFGLAWKVVVAYANLATEQIKDLWPPLWQALKEGFKETWGFVGFMFELEFRRSFAVALAMVAKYADVFGIKQKQIDDDVAKLNAKIAEDQGKAVDKLAERLDGVMKKFNVVEGEGVKKAIEGIKEAQQNIAIGEGFKKMRDASKEMANNVTNNSEAATNGLKMIEEKANHAHQAMQKLQSVSIYSQEGFSRLLEHQDFLSSRNTGTPVPNRATGAGIMDSKKSEALLAKIADNTAKTVKNTEDSPIPGLKIANI